VSKQKISLAHLAQPTDSTDSRLLGAAALRADAGPTPAAEPDAKVRFTNALPPATFQRLQQSAFWSHETIGDVLDEALNAFFAAKPEADRALPEKPAAKKRRARRAYVRVIGRLRGRPRRHAASWRPDRQRQGWLSADEKVRNYYRRVAAGYKPSCSTWWWAKPQAVVMPLPPMPVTM